MARTLFDHLLTLEDANCDILVYTSGQAMVPATDAIQIGQFYYTNRLLINGYVDMSMITLDHLKFTPESIEKH